jgi:hypothetical protein
LTRSFCISRNRGGQNGILRIWRSQLPWLINCGKCRSGSRGSSRPFWSTCLRGVVSGATQRFRGDRFDHFANSIRFSRKNAAHIRDRALLLLDELLEDENDAEIALSVDSYTAGVPAGA